MTPTPRNEESGDPAGSMQLSAFNRLPEAVVALDSEQRVRYVNDRARGLLGLDGDAVGKPLPDCVELTDEAGNDVAAYLLPVAARSGLAARLPEHVFRARLPDGRVRPVSVAARLSDGEVVLTFRHAGRRERLERARSDLIATVSHEIRSPLTSVKGFTRTMLAKWDRFSDEHKRHMLTTINADADRVTRLLNELLDVARIDAGRVQLHRLPVELDTVVARVVEKMRHHHEDRTIEFTVESEPPQVHADPDKVEQIVTNLVENALRYAPDSPVRVVVRAAGDEGHVIVSDEGPGIEADHIRTVFAKFSRGLAERRSGTGLGLYITKGLVEAHGGHVWVESTPGEGATFYVALPIARR